VQQWVKDENAATAASWAPEGHPQFQPAPQIAAAESPAVSVEQPMTELGDTLEATEQLADIPTSTVEQRPFSAPTMDWDATK